MVKLPIPVLLLAMIVFVAWLFFEYIPAQRQAFQQRAERQDRTERTAASTKAHAKVLAAREDRVATQVADLVNHPALATAPEEVAKLIVAAEEVASASREAHADHRGLAAFEAVIADAEATVTHARRVARQREILGPDQI